MLREGDRLEASAIDGRHVRSTSLTRSATHLRRAAPGDAAPPSGSRGMRGVSGRPQLAVERLVTAERSATSSGLLRRRARTPGLAGRPDFSDVLPGVNYADPKPSTVVSAATSS